MSVKTVSPQEVQSLAAFVGSGLVFAGIADPCGMALVLARVPWNRVPWTAISDGPGATCRTWRPVALSTRRAAASGSKTPRRGT